MKIDYSDEPPLHDADYEWNRLVSEAWSRAPLKPMHECLSTEWLGRIIADVTEHDGEMTLELATRIVRAARDEMELPHLLREAGLDRTRGGQLKEPILLAVFLSIQRCLGRRFAPFAEFTDQNHDISTAWDADAALFEGVLRSIGVEGLTLQRYKSVLRSVHDMKNKLNGGQRHRRYSAT